MSLRSRLAISLALLAGLSAVLIGVFSQRATEQRLRAEVDRSIAEVIDAATDPTRGPGDVGLDNRNRPVIRNRPLPRINLVVLQRLDRDGAVVADTGETLPVSDEDAEIARGERITNNWRNVRVDGDPYRMVTVPTSNGAIQAARSLTENERLLDDLWIRIILAVAALIVVAAAAGWAIATTVTRRLTHLTVAAEHVTTTGNLAMQVPEGGGDETGRLAAAFNRMLSALARSREDQQRLIQDASHELRTPLTSLRTNIAVLRRAELLTPEQRRELLDDLDSETRELTDLMNEMIELATDRRESEPVVEVDLAAIAERVAGRTRRRTNREIIVEVDDSRLMGRAAAIERALSNLVDNAAKFDTEGTAPIEIRIRAGHVEVLDRGPGIPPDDLPHIFDRFHRALTARSQPGSGLGLSIVSDVIEAHGGRVFAANREGGGAVIGFTLPVTGTAGTNPPVA